jgi:hypothetical protein
LHPRVDISDGTCTRVPEGGDGGGDGDVHHIVVEQDLDQSPEGPKANLTTEGKPRIINPVSKNLCKYRCYDCAFTFQELNETLDA